MTGNVTHLKQLLEPEQLAKEIAIMYDDWNNLRAGWLETIKETRDYIFATDTTSTTNSKLPWKNKTVVPKITQLRDNLHANYMAALFPNDNWLKWEGYTEEDTVKRKRVAIEAYIENKTRQGGFKETVSQLIYDYIDTGIVLGSVVYEKDVVDLPDGNKKIVYQGPKLLRDSPYDTVFNPVASSFESSPKITRHIKTLGDLLKDAQTRPELGYDAEAIKKAFADREVVASFKPADVNKARGIRIDGFGSMSEYYKSPYVEILEFDGDIYDKESGELLRNYLITIMDRRLVIRKEVNPMWIGTSNKRMTGWRTRPDNLYAQGPLDNLLGMQYRINHLENLKADVFDMVAYPVLKISGDVEEFDYRPGERIYCAEDGDVVFMHPDVTALQADLQISALEQKMEEFAGAPRQAMGIRTPGEKTAFEVQVLENAAGRIFQEKVLNFERFLEEILNLMLESARRNLDGNDAVRVLDEDLGVAEFIQVTREDITATGKLRPMGARHFAATAQLVQNLVSAASSPIGQDPAVLAHVSGKELARVMFEEIPGLRRFTLVRDNIRLFEQAETARLQQQVQEDITVEGQVSPEQQPEGMEQEIPQEGVPIG